MLNELKKDFQSQIAELTHELRVRLPKEIKVALELGDLRENAEYKAALERQELVRIRLGQLSKRMSELATLDVTRLPKDRVAYGSIVEVTNLDTDESITYHLVMPEESDLVKGWISLTSPIGRGFVGKEVDDEVTVQTPGGTKRFSIDGLQTLHDQGEDAEG